MNTTETLIDNLTEELKPRKKLAHPLARALPWMMVAMAYVAGIVNYLGVRPDFAAMLQDSIFLMDTGLMAAVSISAALSAAWLCVPDMRGVKWLVAVPFTLLATFFAWCAIVSHVDGFSMPDMHWDHCFNDAMMMGFLPAAAIMFLTLRGATTKPLTMSLMSVLSVAGLGYVGLRFTCMMDTIGHAGMYHLLPFVVFGALLGAAARFVYRW